MNTNSRDYPLGLRPTVLLGAICLVGWMAFILWPRLLTALGIVDYGMIYLDSYAILEALDASVWAPIVEELTFRGLLYGTLRTRLGVSPSAVLSAVPNPA